MNKTMTWRRVLAASLAAMLAMSLAACSGGTSATKYTITPENENEELVLGNRPEASYWFPEDLLKWNADKDPDLAYNVSTVPLAKRVDKADLKPVNDTQNTDTKVMAISIMNSSTSGNAPHGLNTANANTFSYWQYVDELVYWGGSSGEGIIVPPSPDVTDMGHTNGVPVLGTVFFPQNVSGGKVEWLDQTLAQKSDGSFPVADKLIEVATTYGFDGWFINQETEGENETSLGADYATKMQAFIAYLKKQAPDLRVVYYDSMTKDGSIDWQNALTDENSMYMTDGDHPIADEMFLNFWWTEDKLAGDDLLAASATKAKELGIDPYSLYAGIDVQADGFPTRRHSMYWYFRARMARSRYGRMTASRSAENGLRPVLRLIGCAACSPYMRLTATVRWCRAHAHGVSYCEVWNSRTAICRHRSLYAMAVGQSAAQSTMTRIR